MYCFQNSSFEIFHPNSWHWLHRFSYLPPVGVPDRRITLSGFSPRMNFDRLAFSFWIRELSSNISVKPVRVFSTFRLKVSS